MQQQIDKYTIKITNLSDKMILTKAGIQTKVIKLEHQIIKIENKIIKIQNKIIFKDFQLFMTQLFKRTITYKNQASKLITQQMTRNIINNIIINIEEELIDYTQMYPEQQLSILQVQIQPAISSQLQLVNFVTLLQLQNEKVEQYKNQKEVELIIVTYKLGGCKDTRSFVVALCKFFNIDLKYTRIETIQKERNALVFINDEYTNKFIDIVVEIDFNSFYPTIMLSLQDTINKNAYTLMLKLQTLRDYYQSINDIEIVKIIKNVQVVYIGSMRSQKEYCDYARDMDLHYQIMEMAYFKFYELIKLMESVDQHKVFFAQTDACFIQVQSIESAQILFDIAQQVLPCKLKIHTNFYHFKQTHKYLSMVGSQVVIKGFSKTKYEWFSLYIKLFLESRDPQYLLKAHLDSNIHDTDYSLITSLTKCIESFPNLQPKGTIQIRIEYLNVQNKIQRISQYIKPNDIVELRDKWMSQQRCVAIHECITSQSNKLVFDIDCKVKQYESIEDLQIRIDKIISELQSFVRTHPFVKSLFTNFIISYISKYVVPKKASCHIIFAIVLPLKVQKMLALEAKSCVSEDIDTQIYHIAHSLRIATTHSLKDGLSIQDRHAQTLQIQNEESVVNHLFTNIDKCQVVNSVYVYNNILMCGNAIDFKYDVIITQEDKNKITDAINIRLQEEDYTVQELKFKINSSFGSVQLNKNDIQNQICFICKRTHEQVKNRCRLNIHISKKQITLWCWQNTDKTKNVKIPLETSIVKDIEIQTKTLKQAIVINQPFIIQDLNTQYDIPGNQMLIIRSDLNTGKSSIFEQLVKKFKKVLLVSTRKIYTYQNQKRMGLSDSQVYFHTEGLIKETNIIQVESLNKVDPSIQFDAIILDEFQSIIQQLYRSDESESCYRIKDFIRTINQSYRVIITDAQLEQSSVDFMISQFPQFEVKIIDNQFQSFKNNTTSIYKYCKKVDRNDFIVDKIVSRFNNGQKTWSIITSKKQQLQLSDIIKSLIPQIRIKIFNGNHKSTDNEKIEDPSNQITHEQHNIEFYKSEDPYQQFDLIMATSTITSGLNVTHDKFDYVIADVKHDAISPQQLIQALHRCRFVKHIDIFTTDLQTLSNKTSFQDNFMSGITRHSHIEIKEPQYLLYTLCKQYVDDLKCIGFEYTRFWLERMGYNITYKTLEMKKKNELTIQQNVSIIIPIVPLSEFEDFISYIPLYMCEHPDIQYIVSKYANSTRKQEDIDVLESIYDMAEYGLNAKRNSIGYEKTFGTLDFKESPQQVYNMFLEFINQGHKCTFSLATSRIYKESIQFLIQFAFQYYQILEKHGVVFRNQYYETIKKGTYLRNQIQEKLINEENKKNRYKFYRQVLCVPYKSEKRRETMIPILKHMLSLSIENVQDYMNSDIFQQYKHYQNDFSLYLGFHHQTIRSRKSTELKEYTIKLFDSQYLIE